jgi:hypothetical protein
MKKFLLIFNLLCCLTSTCFSQITQTLKGHVTDKLAGIGLPGVIVKVKGSNETKLSTTTDAQGNYRIKEVPLGRQVVVFAMMGYKTQVLHDIIISSGKEMVLDIDLEESATDLNEVEVNASEDKDVVNTMESVNMKSFNLEETERYPGSRQDPARMAQNFAGIQGTNDSRNDIVVRGNSPSGLLWRLEDIDIPNPNHFAVAGSSGGPQSIINNKYLANSEFYTGAFPANYGNALGGVFDLKMRNGNNEKHERTFQFGFLGTELALEGPLNKKTGASYLVTYRYSTLKLFSSVNFNIGTSAVPGYQDVGFRFHFPTQKAGVFSISGIGGLSDIKIILSKIKERPRELYGDQTRDQYFSSNMGVGILNHTYAFNAKTLMKTTLAYGVQTLDVNHFLVFRDKNFAPKDTLPQILGYDFYEGKSTLSWFMRHKINARNALEAGFFVNRIDIDFYDDVKINSLYDSLATTILNKPFKRRLDVTTHFYLLQPYFNYVHKWSEKWSINAGLFTQYLTLNKRYAIEPRAALKFQPRLNQTLSLSYGLHSQMQQTYLYFSIPDSIISDGVLLANTDKQLANKNLDFSKSQHVVLGYEWQASKHVSIKTEAYYQYLWAVPVYQIKSGVSAINRGATFNRFFPIYTMVNNGTGYNYGLELTIQKSFSKHYYIMYSASVFDSKYKGSDGIEYNTDFNGNYMMNILGGLEYQVGKQKKNTLSFGGKYTYGGGKRYSPVNLAASNALMDVVPEEGKINTLQFPAYNRLDLRVAYKINMRKTSVEIAFDLINILGTKNVLALSYSPDPSDLTKNPLVPNYQLGFLPLFYVKVDF